VSLRYKKIEGQRERISSSQRRKLLFCGEPCGLRLLKIDDINVVVGRKCEETKKKEYKKDKTHVGC